MKQSLQKVVTLTTSKKRPFNIYHLHLTLAKHEPLKKQLRKTTATIIFLFFLTFLYFFFDFFIFMDNGFCSLPAIIHNSNWRSQKYISPIVCLIDFGTKFIPIFIKMKFSNNMNLYSTNFTSDMLKLTTQQTQYISTQNKPRLHWYPSCTQLSKSHCFETMTFLSSAG